MTASIKQGRFVLRRAEAYPPRYRAHKCRTGKRAHTVARYVGRNRQRRS